MYLTLYNVYSNIVRHDWSWFQHVLEWFSHQIWTNPLRTNIEPQRKVEDDHPRNFPVLAFTCFFFLHTTFAGKRSMNSKNGGDIYMFSICFLYLFVTSPDMVIQLVGSTMVAPLVRQIPRANTMAMAWLLWRLAQWARVCREWGA